MNTTVALAAVVVVVAAAAAGLVAFGFLGSPAQQAGVQTTTQQPATTQAGTTTHPQTTTQQSPSGQEETTEAPQQQVDLSGYWHGTYKSSVGPSGGPFCFYFVRAESGYRGVLNISDSAGRYEGAMIPVSVDLEGDRIRVGWVAAGATFSGVVSGDSMSGGWELPAAGDKGTWSASRGYTSDCPARQQSAEGGETNQGANSTQSAYESASDQEARGSLAKYDSMLRETLSMVFGGCKLEWQASLESGYTARYRLPAPVNKTTSVTLGKSLTEAASSAGLTVARSYYGPAGGSVVAADIAERAYVAVSWETGSSVVNVIVASG